LGDGAGGAREVRARAGPPTRTLRTCHARAKLPACDTHSIRFRATPTSLSQKLSQAQSQLAGLDAANATIREENRQLQIRTDKTAQALRIAGQNASKARSDASHAEATASMLAEKLEAFQEVVKETQRSMQALGHEHKHVAERAHKVEMQLVQALAKEATLAARCRQLEARHAAAEGKLHESKKAEQAWRGRYEASQESLHDLQLQLDRANGFHSSRRAHSEQIAKDLQQTLGLLEASTRANQASEDTLRQLQDANRQLQEQVEGQATELCEYRTKSQRDKERLNESYTKALSKAQQLEMQIEMMKATVAAKEEEWKHERKLLLAANHPSKRMTQTGITTTTIQTSATAPEGDTQAPIPPSTPSSAVRLPSLPSFPGGSRSIGGAFIDRGVRVVLPKLGGACAPTTGSASQTCCVCSKPAAYGIIKTCQCGRDQCFKRAHAACASHHSSSLDSGSGRLILCGGGTSTARGGGEQGEAIDSNDAGKKGDAPPTDHEV
jgi:hypothetical protein